MVRSRGTREDYIEQAKEKERKVMLPGLIVAEKFRLFNEIGDAYYAAGKNQEAYRAYRRALRNVVKKDEGRLYRKMERVKPGEKEGGRKKTLGTLVSKFSPALTIVTFAIALFFISFNLTGYSIGGLTQESFRWISTSLFILGLVFVFVYFKNKR